MAATLQSVDLSIVSLLILLFIYLSAFNRLEKIFVQYNLFIGLIFINMILIVVDILAWVFNGLPGQANLLNNMKSNLLLYVLVPIAPSLWVLYVDYQIFRDEKRLNTYMNILLTLWAVSALISCVSLKTGWFFGITDNNIYYRGRYFYLYAAYCLCLLAYSFFLIMLNRNRIERKYYFALQAYLIPQLTGTILQLMFYGVSYNWVGMMLSLLLIYSNIQNSVLNTDSLTGAYNRNYLEAYIRAKLRKGVKGSSFSALFVDLDDLKRINDEYGHRIGDEALRDAVGILKKSVQKEDFIARVGGDEFIVVLDISDSLRLKKTAEKIKENASAFNQSGLKPYHLSFSIGCDVYSSEKYPDPETFIADLDRLMYCDKRKAHGIPS